MENFFKIAFLNSSSTHKKKDIQILRAFATCSVVLIHLLNIGLLNIEKGARGYWFFQLSHSLLQFAVPCFIFISALVLAYSVKDKPLKIWPYYKKKFFHIFIPYFLWTFIYIFLKILAGQISFYKLFRPNSWFYWLAYGKAHTHLYFMSVIIQFYIVAPFLIFFMRKFCTYIKKHQFFFIVLLAFIPQIFIYWINRLYIYSYFSSTATLFPWYWYLCVFGLWIGFNYEEWDKKITNHKKIFISIGMLSILVYIMYQIALYTQVKISTFYYQISWYIYALTLCIALFYLIKLNYFKFSFEPFLLWVSEHSFCIYFMHPLLTFVLSRLIPFSNPFLLVFLLSISFIGILFLCGLASSWLKKRLFLWVLVGEKET